MVLIPQRLLGEALINSENRSPSKTAIITDQKEFTFKDIKEKSLVLARYLVSAGMRKGDRVVIYLNNSWQSVVALYGTSMAGGVFIMVNPQTKSDKLQFILNDSRATILVSENLLRENYIPALENTPELNEVIIAGLSAEIPPKNNVRLTDLNGVLESNIPEVAFPGIIPLDLAALIYTSGSTGFPKGVMMTHQSMVFASWSLIQYLRLSEDDRIMLVLPLAFDYGLYQLLMSVTIGGTLIMEQSFIFPASVYKQIEKWKPTVFPGVPTIYSVMIESHKKSGIHFDSISKITNTAAALLPEMIPDLKQVFPNALIFKMYGLTECKRVCYLEPELLDSKTASVGKAIPGTEVFLLDHDGNPVPPGGSGILHIRGPHVMAGYWNNPVLSDEMLKPGSIPGERILCSHDLFRMDEEGFLYFLGRTDDIIKTRGEKVSPVEIENVLLKTNGVKEAAVIGIPHPVMGESIVAFVTSYDNTVLDEKLILRQCMRNLEMFMMPERVILLENMPKSPNGKIDKKYLKQNLLDNGQ